MALPLLTFTSLVQRFAASAQGNCAALLDFTVGSVLRAIGDANAAVALWMQWLILQVLALTRAATSASAALDSWMADFGFVRLPASPAAGLVVFSRYTPTVAALIVPGAQVKSADGTQTYTVTASTSNAAWSVALGGYVIAAGVSSASVPVVALVAGAAANAVIGAVTLLASAIPGVDTVTNAAAFVGGINAEPDPAFRARFALYIQGLSQGTAAAIGSAIANVQQGLTYTIAQNATAAGGYLPGNFVVTINDGSGYPSAALQSLVYAAVDKVRAITTTFSVQAPTILVATISMTLTAAAGFTKANMQGPLASAVSAYIASLPIGSSLYFTRLAQVVYDAVPGVASITGLTINGAAVDLVATPSSTIIPGTVTVN